MSVQSRPPGDYPDWSACFEADTLAREFGEHYVLSYICPCCGDPVIDKPPVCEACRSAGCEQTRDGSGELGWWRCQRPESAS